MSSQGPGRAPATPALTPLPRHEDVERRGEGYDPDQVKEAFDAFRRHAAQLQAQLRVLQAAGRSARVDPSGHAVRMDALHLIRAAAEFADALERDAQNASAQQLGRTEEEVRRRQRHLQEREAEIERYRIESERQRSEMLNAARNEARELLANANRDASQELREAEARGARLLEQSRHQATELTNSARAEVEQTLEWARAQASSILSRAQQGAQQLLTAAGLGEDALTQVSDAIVRAAEEAAEQSRPSGVAAPAWSPDAEGGGETASRPALASVPEPQQGSAAEPDEPTETPEEGGEDEPTDQPPSSSRQRKGDGKGGRSGGSQQ
jgi:hypothetical protein